MSLINKMLQELDRRHAPQPEGATPGLVPNRNLQPVRGPTRMVGSEWYWRVVATLILITIGWIAWVAWQVTPRVNVTELALQSQVRSAPAATAAATAAASASAATTATATATPVATPVAVAPPAASAPTAAALPGSPTPAPPANKAKSEADRPDTLKLALEILTPIRERGARVPAAGPPVMGQEQKRAVSPAAAPIPDTSARPAIRLETMLVSSPSGASPASGQINKRESATPRERAASEYRRAVSFVNQGRIAEGMEAFRAALTFDPSYEAARQTQVALLLEAKRMDEAAALLQEGIALNPANTAFVMLLARIMVERNDVAGALVLLQQHAQSAAANAEFHAFAAALYQRLGRHSEAVTEYGAALRVAPASGVWWVGLGISQEAQQRGTEAAESFRRARDTGTLSAELAGFVERKLKAAR